MKPSQKILLAFLAVFLCACVLSPLAKIFVDRHIDQNEWLARKLHFDRAQNTYDFGRVFRRLLMASALVFLLLAWKPLNIFSTLKSGFLPLRKWVGSAGLGLAVGLVSMGAFLTLLHLLGVSWIGGIAPQAFLRPLPKYLTQALFIALFEETLFRGFLLPTLAKDMQFLSSACLTSVVYAGMHFVKAQTLVTPGMDLLVGCKALGALFAPFASQAQAFLALLGLFLLGLLFAYAFRWSGSLILPIVLHASWVLALKEAGIVLTLGSVAPEWLYGTKLVVDGVLGFLFLLLVFGLLWILLGRRASARRRAGEEAPPTPVEGKDP
ncbi:MAG: lysostaphin resistance A-like protein [Planctomycetota bacterium]|jgi:membrane protease YdiL (CAAX protease family)